MTDPRESAMRYRAERDAQARGEQPQEMDAPPPPAWTAREQAAYVETAIEQAIRAGAFDDLPGAGKPIPDLGSGHDPDWWIRRKIQREQLSGLGPPALTLRGEFAVLDERIDEMRRESEVREHLEDFNRRVIEARRQLLGGPPVVTPTVDVEERVQSWLERRETPHLEGEPVVRPRRWARRAWRPRGSSG